MTIITDIVDRIYAARNQQEAAYDELERLEGTGDTRGAESALQAAVEAEHVAMRELSRTPATSHEDMIPKAMILLDYTHGQDGKNLYEPIWEDDLPALHASIQRDGKALGVRV
jgi:hypothetical protein